MIEAIIKQIRQDEKIVVVSFDIFDTLLFRTVRRPDEVFLRMYELYPEKFPGFSDGEDWRTARKEAEQKAKQKALIETGSREVYLEQIYKELPTIYSNVEELRNLELLTEKKTCYINSEMYETLLYIKEELGKKVVLISDMYLEERFIREILSESGMDCSVLDAVYVSCEYKASKGKGDLYEIIMQELGIYNFELFHIGDNYYGDVGVAKRLGISCWLYDLISEAYIRHPYLYMEELIYGSICKEIHALRLQAANKNQEIEKEKRLLFDIGAMIVGPMLTYATEWVLDEAETKGINVIRPLMREGRLLTELLSNANQDRHREVSIKPLFISRLAAFSGIFDRITEKEVRYLLGVAHLTVHDIFSLLHIEELEKNYEKYADVPTERMRNVQCGEESLYDSLYNYLSGIQVIEDIRSKNRNSSDILYEYLCQEDLDKKSITLDVGWQGNIQNIINSIIRKHNSDVSQLHLLFFSRDTAVKNAVNGCDIRGFVGNFGKNRDDLAKLSVKIFEIFFLCQDGTTIGYKKDGVEVKPVLYQIEYPAWQVEAMRILQRGIKAFQEQYLQLVKLKPEIRFWTGYNVELCQLLGRLFAAPQFDEASALGKLSFDQNNGANCFVPVIKEQFVQKYKSEGKKKFYLKYRSSEEEWYSGINAYIDPAFYYEMHLLAKGKYTQYSLFTMIQNVINVVQDKQIVIIGAGGNTRRILSYLASLNKLSIVEGIVDNNKDLHGSSLGGNIIKPVDSKFKTNIYFCSIMVKAVRDSLYEQVCKFHNDNIRFISYFEGDDGK